MATDHDDTWDTDADTSAQMSGGKAGPSGQEITAALMSAEPDVDLPSNGRPASVISNLVALKVGDNYTKSFRIPGHLTLEEVRENTMKWKSDLRASLNTSLRHARKADERRQYSMESTITTTPNGVVYVQVITTRTS